MRRWLNMPKSPSRLKRVTMNLPVKLCDEITRLAEQNGLNFTSQSIALLRNGIDQNVAVKLMPTIVEQLLSEQNKAKNQKIK